ncbi:MAG: PAS domain S-box protein, partial [Desulfobulbaceae bacterium]|nr:PAS domain S-box protein [Desulfobulbaceae bacterium]HIJ79940.1 PAS domain S-box protein [Deltaproteobacteria bacterium]
MEKLESAGRKNFLFLVAVMTGVAIAVGAAVVTLLYHSAFEEAKGRFFLTAASQARLLEAVARFDRQYSRKALPGGAWSATFTQLKDAHEQIKGFGKTGEFLVGHLVDGNIVYLLSHRTQDISTIPPVPMDSNLAMPMRFALQGKNGTIIADDYQGHKVLAAYHHVDILDLGIVVKIDLAEMRAPFIKAALLAAIVAAFVFGIGIFLFFKFSRPILTEIEQQNRKLLTNESTIKNIYLSLQEHTLELEAANALLRQKDEEMRLLLNSTSEAIYSLDLMGNCTMVNAACLRMIGVNDESEIIGKNMHGLIHHTTAAGERYRENQCPVLKALHADKGCHVDDEFFWRADGTCFAVEYWSFPIIKEKKTIGVVVTFLDISERKQAEADLRAAEKNFRQLRESLSDGYVSVSMKGEIIDFNAAYMNMLDYNEDEIRSLTYQQLTPSKWHAMESEIVEKQILAWGYSDIYEKEYIRKDGATIPIELRVFLARDDQGNPLHMWGIISDISARKKAEKRLRDSLAEKEVLLKEIHHRVKNNMQIISSLLYLQGKNSDSAEVQALVIDSMNRVRSMAMIHEKLYRSEDLAHIDFSDYIHSLGQQIMQAHLQVAHRVTLDIQADNIFLPLDSA